MRSMAASAPLWTVEASPAPSRERELESCLRSLSGAIAYRHLGLPGRGGPEHEYLAIGEGSEPAADSLRGAQDARISVHSAITDWQWAGQPEGDPMAAPHIYFVCTSPVDGREDEYNTWYSNQHLADVIAVSGFSTARRYRTERASAPGGLPYLALYAIVGDPAETLAGLGLAREQGRMPISPALDSNTKSAVYSRLD